MKIAIQNSAHLHWTPHHSARSVTQRLFALQSHKARRGSVLGLMAFLLPVLAILAAFAVNAAHMQTTRTELMVATDASARAAGRAFSEIQTVEAAQDAALTTAAMNSVDGAPLELDAGDNMGYIEFGTITQPNGAQGRYQFTQVPTSAVESGAVFASAVRIVGRRDEGSLSGSVPLLFPTTFSISDFNPVTDAVAMQVDRDISLVIDRSGSMDYYYFDFPYGTSPWYYSTLNAGVSAGMIQVRRGRYYYASGVDEYEYMKWAWEDHYNLGPAPIKPWEALELSVEAFLEVLEETDQEEQVSVASYSSNATLDIYLSEDYDAVIDTVDQLYPSGATAIGRGMQQGIETLLHSNARPYAAKTMVVMTDGIHNTGISPTSVAQSLVSQYDVTITCVTFGSGADQATMQQVASIGGGQHYHANTGAELVAIYEEIANNIPTIITD